MLVLSRREMDEVRFPDLGITIEVLRIKGNTVRIGIEAPREVRVLRGELEPRHSANFSRKVLISDENEHEVRNKLNSLGLAMALAQNCVASGRVEQAATILAKAIRKIECKSSRATDFDLTKAFAASPVAESSNSIRALLVEDVENERTMLSGLLRMHGFTVDAVADGEKALDYLDSNETPNVILMDMGLPNLDGASTIRSIRQSPTFDPVKIFAISGQTPASIGIDIAKNRISHWFQKPLEPKKLVDRIWNSSTITPKPSHQD